MDALDNFYLKQPEPNKSVLLALRSVILKQDSEITATLKYSMPFFCYKGKMFCYLWINKKNNKPYIGFVEGNRLEHPELISEKRSRMKILSLDADKDLPIETIENVLNDALLLYKSGIVKI